MIRCIIHCSKCDKVISYPEKPYYGYMGYRILCEDCIPYWIRNRKETSEEKALNTIERMEKEDWENREAYGIMW